MTIPMTDETRYVIDDNMPAQVQSKVKTIDTVLSTQSSLKELSIEDDQMQEDLKNLTKFKRVLNLLKQEEEKFSKTNGVRTLAKQVLEIRETIEKVEEKIQKLINRIKTKKAEKITGILHAQVDGTGTHNLFDKLSNIGNVPIFSNNFQQYIKKYEFDDVFDKDNRNTDPRENEILCEIIKEGRTESLDVAKYSKEAIVGTLHESSINPVKQRLYDHKIDQNMRYEKFLISTVIETVRNATKEFKKLSIDTSIENKQRNQALIDLETYEIFLNKLTTKKNKITNEAKQDDDISNLDQLMELDEKIEKTSNIILRLQKSLESIDSYKDVKRLHERNDSTGKYYLFDTLTSKNRKFYPKDWVFKHKMTKIGNIPVFLNNFQQFIEKYQFDNIFDPQIQNIDPRENEILCEVIKEGFNESPAIMNINTGDIFRIIRDLKKKYASLFGRDIRQKAWEKVLVDTTCKDTDLLMNELQKLVLMEKWTLSQCCQNCPNLTHILKEAILGTLHESLRNPVKQRLHIYSIDENERIEEILINIVIETVMDLSSTDSNYSERNCKYCKSELHSSVNCRKKLNKNLGLPRPATQKVNIRKVQPKKNTLKLAQN
ncbi:uncharacterized protein SKDI_14G0500 [Saccharomyces kudriavzevii IFO 1802]|uniref:Uncharacterized protein n=1 Tax=Saccharomyces kudriavzevii (strain ATCC MYA-4449 / AS 2.2408 / CBS 8840 / NBRC 1802 / NCYC 2889) TaxID=226230 RepID=A0AA35J5H0_SACK1|nr:uncharacterized protein SKDI_14G0500 [Saccharomyces kudriavzevii IFO 1802]CAI4049344.1 hypothetical protein SKDI_14G0500 [Saccharomyces kudriavzevii IFO 1802]